MPVTAGRLRSAAVLLAAASLVGALWRPGLGPWSLAAFVDGDATDAAFGTDTLDPPTGLSAAGGPFASLAWTPSVDAYASGYRVYRSSTSGSGHAEVATATPVSLAATTDVPPASGTWFYVLRTAFQGWESVPTAEVSAAVVLPPTATALVPCAVGTSSAEAGWGDGDGYETSPDDACADDGIVATDANTGSPARSAACTNTANDAHRYRGFGLGLPPTILAVGGIEVSADVSVSNNGGTSNLCVQLSWDGGGSWTAPKWVAVNNVQTAHVLGGPADTWGRAWTGAELDGAVFRVRVIDATTQNNKAYRLDQLAVRVTYTP